MKELDIKYTEDWYREIGLGGTALWIHNYHSKNKENLPGNDIDCIKGINEDETDYNSVCTSKFGTNSICNYRIK